jgi:glutathione peroxidase-family protein
MVKVKHLRKSAFHEEDIESPQQDDLVPVDSIYSMTYPTMKHHGEHFQLSNFAGRVAIVINVASEWGKTDLTYGHIKDMLRQYSSSTEDNGQAEAEQGGAGNDHNNNLVILAFPTNDFHQETGTNEDIEIKVKELLGEDYDNPNFILFHKSTLEHNPIYKMLRVHMPESEVKHNFYKYLIGRDGVPVAFYSKKQTLFDMEAAVRDELETV